MCTYDSYSSKRSNDARDTKHQQNKDSLLRVLRHPRHRCYEQITKTTTSSIMLGTRSALLARWRSSKRPSPEWRPPQLMAWHIGIIKTANCTAPRTFARGRRLVVAVTGDQEITCGQRSILSATVLQYYQTWKRLVGAGAGGRCELKGANELLLVHSRWTSNRLDLSAKASYLSIGIR